MSLQPALFNLIHQVAANFQKYLAATPSLIRSLQSFVLLSLAPSSLKGRNLLSALPNIEHLHGSNSWCATSGRGNFCALFSVFAHASCLTLLLALLFDVFVSLALRLAYEILSRTVRISPCEAFLLLFAMVLGHALELLLPKGCPGRLFLYTNRKISVNRRPVSVPTSINSYTTKPVWRLMDIS